MAYVVDNALVACVVAVAFCYAIYALGPAKLRVWILTQIGRYLGVRILGLLLRKSSTSSGCAGCAAAATHHPVKTNLQLNKNAR